MLPMENFNHIQSWKKTLPFPEGLFCSCHCAIDSTPDFPNSYSSTGFIILQLRELCFKEFVHFSDVSQLESHWAGSAFGHSLYLTIIANLPISCIAPVYVCMCSVSFLELFISFFFFFCWRVFLILLVWSFKGYLRCHFLWGIFSKLLPTSVTSWN